MDAVRGLRIVRDEMRRRGWEVREVTGWEQRGRGAPIVPRGAVNHWTAGARTGNAPSLRVVTHGRAGLRNALCHTYSDRRAHLYLVAARVAWHAGRGSWPGLRGNADCLGHEPECAGPGDWRPGQLELIADLDVVQADVFGYPHSKIIDHFEWAGPRKPDRRDVGGPPWRRRLATLDDEEIDMSPDELREIVREEIERVWYHDVNGRSARTLLNQTHRAATEVRDGQVGDRNVDADLQGMRLGIRDLLRRAGAKVKHDPPDEHVL